MADELTAAGLVDFHAEREIAKLRNDLAAMKQSIEHAERQLGKAVESGAYHHLANLSDGAFAQKGGRIDAGIAKVQLLGQLEQEAGHIGD